MQAGTSAAIVLTKMMFMFRFDFLAK